MGDRRLFALVKKFGGSAISLASALGLVSVFAVHVSGFLALLPRSLWPLIDIYFVSGLLLRFSLLMAAAFLAARYSNYIVSSVVGGILSFMLMPILLLQQKYQRFIRRKGLMHVVYFARNLERAEEKYGYKYKSTVETIMRSQSLRTIAGCIFLNGCIRGSIDSRIKRWSIVVQGMTALMILSLTYIDAYSGFLIFLAFILLVILFPPSPWEAYASRPYVIFGVNPMTFFRLKLFSFFSLPKITVITLTVSFLLGFFHHKALLRQEIRVIDQAGVEDVRSVLVATTAGFIFFKSDRGYWYVGNSRSDFETLSPAIEKGKPSNALP